MCFDFFFILHLLWCPLGDGKYALVHAETSAWQHAHAICPGTVVAGNETKCGEADRQMNETATESLALFDLPPLIQIDHLINWEDGMYIRIARGVSLLFPIHKQITPQPPREHPEGRMFPYVCVSACVCVRERERMSLVAKRCEFSGGPVESKWRSTCVNILTAMMSHKAPWPSSRMAPTPACKKAGGALSRRPDVHHVLHHRLIIDLRLLCLSCSVWIGLLIL